MKESKIIFWDDFTDKKKFGSDNDMKKEMDLFFKELLKGCEKEIPNFWGFYNTQMERDKGPYINFGTTNGNFVDKEFLITLLHLEGAKTFWNMRAKFIRTIMKEFNITLYDEVKEAKLLIEVKEDKDPYDGKDDIYE